MNPFEIEGKLTAMVGKQFIYKRKNQRVLRYEVKEKTVRIVTDIEDVTVLSEDLKDMLNLFLPVEESDEFTPTTLQVSASRVNQTVIGSSGQDLKNILMDNIKKIERDKEFIPQATAICEQVKSIIDIAKAEVELLKAMRG